VIAFLAVVRGIPTPMVAAIAVTARVGLDQLTRQRTRIIKTPDQGVR